MSSMFLSSQLLTLPITKTRHTTTSSSSSSPPPPPPPPAASSQPLQTSATPLNQQATTSRRTTKTNVAESTDWIASSLTRRFGLGAGLAWVGFLAFGVVSEQIKTRLEVSQEAANTR